MSENDFFGFVYPLNESKLSQSFTETIGRTELIRISREKLRRICRRHTRIELAVIDLYRVRANQEGPDAMPAVRKADRHKLPVKMNLKIWPGTTSHYGLILDGLSRDISVNGMCIVLDANTPMCLQYIIISKMRKLKFQCRQRQ